MLEQFFIQIIMHNLGYVWLLAALFLLLAELSTPGLFFFVAFAVGAGAASLTAFLGMSLAVQCILGLAVAIISFLWIGRSCAGSDKYSNTTNIYNLIGKDALVIKEIELGRVGRIKVRGEEWPAISEHDEAICQGSTVKIIKISGNRLIVKRVDQGDA